MASHREQLAAGINNRESFPKVMFQWKSSNLRSFLLRQDRPPQGHKRYNTKPNKKMLAPPSPIPEGRSSKWPLGRYETNHCNRTLAMLPDICQHFEFHYPSCILFWEQSSILLYLYFLYFIEIWYSRWSKQGIVGSFPSSCSSIRKHALSFFGLTV